MLGFVFAVVLAQVTPPPAASPAPWPSPAPLTVSPAAVNLNPAQQRIVTLNGATPPLTLTLDRKLVTITAAPDASSVTITATQATGSDTLHVTDASGATADIAVRVAFNAGTIVPQTTLTVTGDPAQPDWLAQEVGGWVARLTQAQPGTQTTIATVTPPPNPLVPGASASFVVPVQIAGNGQYFDQSGSTTVTVQNTPLDPFVPALLFYDDDPEHMTQDGVLFRGVVAFGQPARIYYYHDDTLDPRRLVVVLQSNSEDPTSVQLVSATAGPNIDVMQVGQALTKKFLLTKTHHEGVVVDLSGDQPYLMTDLPLALRQLAAGTADLRVLSGGPVQITVLAVSSGVSPLTLLAAPVLPGDGHHRTGVYALSGFGAESLQYAAGGPDATLVLGDTDPTPPNLNPSSGDHDYGDYGVLHTVNLTLRNPAATPSTAYLFFQPLAGPARGSFLIDGTLNDIGCVRASSRYQISSFELAAGQTMQSAVQTMTDGGSFYPVRIGVTATPPIPQAPAIDAPDGCFPKPQTQ